MRFFVTGATGFIEAFALTQEITGIRAPRIHASPALIRTMAAFSELMEKLVPLSEGYSSETLRVAAGAMYLGSNAKARRDLGFGPRPLKQGLQETLLPRCNPWTLILERVSPGTALGGMVAPLRRGVEPPSGPEGECTLIS